MQLNYTEKVLGFKYTQSIDMVKTTLNNMVGLFYYLNCILFSILQYYSRIKYQLVCPIRDLKVIWSICGLLNIPKIYKFTTESLIFRLI